MKEKNRNSIEVSRKVTAFTTMNVIDVQAGLISYASLIFYSLTIDNILNIMNGQQKRWTAPELFEAMFPTSASERSTQQVFACIQPIVQAATSHSTLPALHYIINKKSKYTRPFAIAGVFMSREKIATKTSIFIDKP